VRILELIPTLSVGGAERVVSLLAEALAADHDVTVVSLGPPTGSWIEDRLTQSGVAVRYLGKPPGLHPRTIPRLARVLRAVRPDVAHTHLHVLKYLLPARLAVRRLPIVHTLHNVAEHEAESLDQALQQVAFRAGVHAVSIGGAVTESVSAVYGRPPSAVIANGIPVADYRAPAADGEAVRAALSIPASAPLLLAVGRLNTQKNHADLLTAFADPRLASAHLMIAGDGDLRGALEAQVGQQGLRGRVHLLGIRRDVPALLAAADAFVLSSTWEGNPLVIMEAMAAGKAIISTSVGCVPELVEAGCGRLVPPGDPGALASALAWIASDRAVAVAAGAAARAVADRRFDVSVMATAYAELFRTVGRASR